MGTAKRLVARASLQETINDQILTPHDMYTWAKSIKGKSFFFLTQDQIEENAIKFKLEERFESCKTIAGTRSHHSFIPCTGNTLQMRRLSLDNSFTVIKLGNDYQTNISLNWEDCQPGTYIACIYDDNWYVGNIIECSEEHSDILVSFMNRNENNILSWPTGPRKDECWVPIQHVLCLINAPSAQSHRVRNYIINFDDLNKIKSLYLKFVENE